MAAESQQLRKAAANAGVAARKGDPVAIAETRKSLATERIAVYIERVVADAPPLTEAQRDRLSALLRGVAA